MNSSVSNPLPLVVPINLSRRHIPINPNCRINNQSQYDHHIEMLKYLYDQLELGFNPKYLITYHLKHPRDYLRPIKETNKKYGHRDRIGFRGCGDLWKKVGYDKYMTQMRNDYDFTVKDNRYVQKLIFKWLYGISKIKKDTVLPRMMYFIEQGKVKLQHHIHILLSGNMLYDKEVDITDTLNSSIRMRAKCISLTKPIHCQVVDKPSFAMSYLNKEMSKEHLSLDTQNSILIKKL